MSSLATISAEFRIIVFGRAYPRVFANRMNTDHIAVSLVHSKFFSERLISILLSQSLTT